VARHGDYKLGRHTRRCNWHGSFVIWLLTRSDDDETVVVVESPMSIVTFVDRRKKRAKHMTLTEYLATPETALPSELIYGSLCIADAPLVPHQRAVLRFYQTLEALAFLHDIGEVLVAPLDVILDANAPLVLQPDLLLVSHERAHIVRDRVYGAPDLIVEVLSPRPRIGDLDERVRWFVEYGVREIWLYEQGGRTLDVLVCEAGRVQSRRRFAHDETIVSTVLKVLNTSTAEILR